MMKRVLLLAILILGFATSPESHAQGGCPVIKIFSATMTTIAAGESVTLSWEATGARVVNIGGIGEDVGWKGSLVVTPKRTSNYTLVAIAPKCTKGQTLTITVK
jgi:hypothetical protein